MERRWFNASLPAVAAGRSPPAAVATIPGL